jgi:S-methylmethionine-dependent homocysteine/selenocysteine methylase
MSTPGQRLVRRLGEDPPLVMDGAMGTELERRGVPTPAPLWSAAALVTHPEVVVEVHRAYARAGADILVTNTFRSQRRSLAAASVAGIHTCAGLSAAELTARAVEFARRAADERTGQTGKEVCVLASMGPLEDCYRPDLVPDESTLDAEHGEHAAQLAGAGADALLVETMNTRREALAAIAAGRATGLPVLAGFVANSNGDLFDGDRLADVIPALIDAGAAAVLVNCTPVETTRAVVEQLRSLAAETPFGAYANNGYGHPAVGWVAGAGDVPGRKPPLDPAHYAEEAGAWLSAGANVVGGCCGTTPEHCAAIATMVQGARATPRR